LISRLNHAIAVTRWDLDYVFGMCFEKLINIGVDRNYGAQRTRLLLTAPFGEGGSQTKVFALENPRNYIEDRSTRDFVSIWDEPGKKMRDLAPYAKRNDQPAKASR
jgi:hypothetical protein